MAKMLSDIITENSEIQVHCFEIKINKSEPWSEQIEVSIDENKFKKGFLILVDDVINSGKTMQYALVKFLERPTKTIRTVVLVDRKHRRYPVKADIVGMSLSTTLKDRVEVDLNMNDSKAFLV
jgi:pyrimidine operon attenuation protein/uracil phosphoribosyltransferase